MTSNPPPIVSPASLAASMSAIICRSTSASTQRSGLSSGSAAACSKLTSLARGQRRVAEDEDVAGDARTRAGEELLGDGAGGDPGGGFARARALEDVTHVARART